MNEARENYARALTGGLSPPEPRLCAAFATVPRENFLGPPPWSVRGMDYRPMLWADPAALYHDVLVVLDDAKGLNNGSPALHAQMLHWLAPQPGEAVLHVGTGGGYYTAILAELVGPQGRVLAVEYDRSLARASAANLRPWPNVTVVQGDGAAFPGAPVAAIYVNAAVADLPDPWLDNLAPGGRLVVPLGAPYPGRDDAVPRQSDRAMVLIVARDADGYAARFGGQVGFVFAEGPLAADPAQRAALYAALANEPRAAQVRRLHRARLPAETCFFATDRWSLV